MFNTQIVTESFLILIARVILFISCRKYLLRSLYHDLQGLSSPILAGSTITTPEEDSGMELGTLPTPILGPSLKKQSFIRKHPLHSAVARTAFAVCFVESLVLFMLLICQGSDLLSSQTRLLNWRIALLVLITTILVVVPVCISIVLTVGSSPTSLDTSSLKRSLPRVKILLSLVPVGVYLFALSYVPLPAQLPAADTASTMTKALARLLVIGTLILGFLSGFGAVSNASTLLPSKTRSHAPSQTDVEVAERSLARIRADTDKLKAELHRRESSSREQSESAGSSWFARVIPTLRGDSSLQELHGLEALEYQMARNVEHLRARYAASQFEQTFRGRVSSWALKLWGVYCVVRIFSSAVNLSKQASQSTAASNNSTDMIARFLASGLAVANIKLETGALDVASIARQISLALVGGIILSTVRRVLKGVTNLLRVSSRNVGASLMLLILTQLMGIYLLSTIVQLRNTFPPIPSGESTSTTDDDNDVNLFSTIPHAEVFGFLFDFAVVLSSAVSALVMWGAGKINDVGND